ncbi:MAG: glutaredoxin family protein [Spirochaetes bacterium]|nr:glutaredoxin family protein [Spirochaetota bacterium]
MIHREYFKRSGSVKGDPRVYLYALSDCEHCKAGMAFLDSHGIPYRYVYVDELPPEVRIAFKKEVGKTFFRNLLFPMLELPNGELLFGFEEPIWKEKLALPAS